MLTTLHQNYLDDGRGRFPDRITAAAPRGLRDRVRAAAVAESVSCGQLVREAIEARLQLSTRGRIECSP